MKIKETDKELWFIQKNINPKGTVAQEAILDYFRQFESCIITNDKLVGLLDDIKAFARDFKMAHPRVKMPDITYYRHENLLFISIESVTIILLKVKGEVVLQ